MFIKHKTHMDKTKRLSIKIVIAKEWQAQRVPNRTESWLSLAMFLRGLLKGKRLSVERSFAEGWLKIQFLTQRLSIY